MVNIFQNIILCTNIYLDSVSSVESLTHVYIRKKKTNMESFEIIYILVFWWLFRSLQGKFEGPRQPHTQSPKNTRGQRKAANIHIVLGGGEAVEGFLKQHTVSAEIHPKR